MGEGAFRQSLTGRLLTRLTPSEEVFRERDHGWLATGLWFVPRWQVIHAPTPAGDEYEPWQAQVRVALGWTVPRTVDLQIDFAGDRTFRVQALHLWVGRLGIHVFGMRSIDMVYDRSDYTVKAEEDDR